MRRKLITLIGALILGLSLLAMSCGPAAEKPSEFYQGKSIDYTIYNRPGGSVDSVARLMATYLDKLTGATSVATTRRGSGGLEGIMWVYRAHPDGLTIGVGASTTLMMNKVFGAPGADYELNKISYLWGVNKEPLLVYVAAKGPYQSIADLQAGRDLIVGGTSATGTTGLGGLSLIHLLDLDAKRVPGYKGIEGLVLAMEQGEIVASALPVSSAMAAYKAGRVKPLVVIGSHKVSAFPDVPSMADVVSLTGDKKEIVEMWDNLRISQIFFSSPGVPDDRLKYIRKIGEEVMADSEFRGELAKIMGYEVEIFLNGKEMTEDVTAAGKLASSYKPLMDMLISKYSKE